MGNEHLLVNVENNVMYLTLNRPDRLNAFSPKMIDGLMEVFETAKHDESVRAVVVLGAGRSFCAGGDVKGMGQGSPTDVYDHIGHLNELIMAMSEVPKPIIAAIHGYAAGAGVCLAMACDLIVAAEDSQFALSFSQVGLISDGGGLFFLPRTIGTYRAKELLFTGEPIDAEKAERWGIVNHIYPANKLEERVTMFAEKLAKGPSKAYGMIKKIANLSLNNDLKDILEVERTTQAMIATSDDHKEGVSAFNEKRRPEFKGK